MGGGGGSSLHGRFSSVLLMFVACSYGGGRGIALATARPNDCGARAISPFRRVAPMTTA
jgi:hypothetical protein